MNFFIVSPVILSIIVSMSVVPKEDVFYSMGLWVCTCGNCVVMTVWWLLWLVYVVCVSIHRMIASSVFKTNGLC